MIDTDKLVNEIVWLVLYWSNGDPRKLSEAEEILSRTTVLRPRKVSNARQGP